MSRRARLTAQPVGRKGFRPVCLREKQKHRSVRNRTAVLRDGFEVVPRSSWRWVPGILAIGWNSKA